MTQIKKASVISNLPLGSIDISATDLRTIYNDKFFLGFSTWATTEMPQKSVNKLREYVQETL